MTRRLKFFLRVAGSTLSLGGIVFVVLRLREYSHEINISSIGAKNGILIVGLIFLYGIANPILALAWQQLLVYFGVTVSRRWAFKVYGITQIAKYIPGNIFHIASRQTMGMTSGVEYMALIKSSIWELGLIASTAALFGTLVLPVIVPSIAGSAAVTLFLALSIIIFIYLNHTAPAIGRAFCCQLLFLIASGLIFIGIIHLISNTDAPWPFLCGSYVLAWLAGFITPGAPAGAGVREIVLVFLLKGVIAEADLLFVILLGRIVTVGGDGLFFLVSLILSEQVQKDSP